MTRRYPAAARRPSDAPIARSARHLDLVGPALFDQTDHGVSFGHPIGHDVVGEHDSRNLHRTVTILGSN